MNKQARFLTISVVSLLLSSSFARAGDARQLLAEADRLAWLYNWPKARPLYGEADVLFTQAGDDKGALAAKLGRIRAETATKSLPEASDYLAKELQNPIVQDDPKLLLRCLVAKGEIDREIDPPSARAAWQEALALARKLGDKGWETRAGAELGAIAFMDGDVAEATKLMKAALFSAYTQGDMATMIMYGATVGTGFVELGSPEAGLEYCDRALKAAETIKDMGFPFVAYSGKARALVEMGRQSEARAVLEQAVAQARLQGARAEESELLIVLGKQSAAENDRRGAIEYLETAAALGTAGGFHHSIAWSMFELAKLYKDSGELQKAEQSATVALRAMRQVQDKYHLPLHWALLAELKAKAGKVREADKLYEQASDIVEGILVNVLSRQRESSLIASMGEIYVGHFTLAAAQLRDIDKAYQILETARGRSITDMLRSIPVAQAESGPKVRSVEKEVSRLQLRLLRSSARDERRRLLERLFEMEQVLYAYGQVHPLQKVMLRNTPVLLSKLRSSLRPDEIILEYVLTEPRSFCLSVTREHATVSVLPTGRKRVEEMVEKYLAEVRSRKDSPETGSQLYSLLLGPVPAQSRKFRLVIVPDGKLHLLPFDSLTDSHGQYVLKSHIVTYAPSANVLYLLRTSRPNRETSLPFLGVGGVTYDHGTDSPGRSNSMPAETATRGVYDLRGTKLRPLPGSREEVIAASEMFGKGNVLLLGRDATERAFKAEPLGNFKILHLAVHGIASTKFPERAALVLGIDPGSSEDGLLQAREISLLPLNAELVTLSACDTGVGRLQGEEGIANLVQAFLFAGAKSVLASLWSADDTYTTALMKEFYRNLANKQDQGLALRRAKLSLINQFDDRTAPFYWAGFILVGEASKPIIHLE